MTVGIFLEDGVEAEVCADIARLPRLRGAGKDAGCAQAWEVK